MAFDAEKFTKDLQEAIAYCNAHYTEIRREGCRCYGVEVCKYPYSCKWHPKKDSND